MSALRNVIVVGASGNIGAIITRHLVQDQSLNLSVLTRDSSNATFPPEAKVIRADFTEASLVRAFTGQDVVISVVGAAAMTDQKVYIDAAVKAGVKRFLPSEFGIDSLSEASKGLLPLMAARSDVLEYLKTKQADGLTWTALFTGLLFDWCLRASFLGFEIAAKKATIWDQGTTPYSVTNDADLGKAVQSILHKPVETANKTLYVRSVSTTQKEILEAFEAQTGPWTKENVNTKEMIAMGQKLLGEGSLEGAFVLVQALAYGDVPGVKADFGKDGELANGLLEVPAGSVVETVKKVLQS